MFAAITAAGLGCRVALVERGERLGKKLLITGKGRCNVTNACTAQEVLENTPRNSRFLYSAMTALERGERLGKKLLITGKGRCNVTNACTAQEVLENTPRNSRFLYSAMTAFPPEKIMAFFEDHGCPLKTERGNRVFPVSDKSSSVLHCLTEQLRRQGVTVVTGRVKEILTRDGRAVGAALEEETLEADWVILATGGLSYPATGSVTVVTGRVKEILTRDGRAVGAALEEETLEADWVILATGGLSYPATGSTGDGYAMAQALGHKIVPGVGGDTGSGLGDSRHRRIVLSRHRLHRRRLCYGPGPGAQNRARRGQLGASGNCWGGLPQNAGPLPAQCRGQAGKCQGKGAAVYPLWRIRPHGALCQLPSERGGLPPGAGFEAGSG